MANLELVKQTSPIEQFVDYLFENLHGYSYVPILDRETGKFNQRFFKWPEERTAMVEWILTHSVQKDVYIAPAIFKAEMLSRDSFKESNVVWTEFDGNIPDAERLGNIPEPTLRVRSSGSGFEHWYWKLKDKLLSPTETEAINRSLTYTLGADASSWDCTQILRIPGTINHKKSTPVYVALQSEMLLTSSAFTESLNFAPEPSYDFTPDTIPDVSEVVLSHAFPKPVQELYRTSEFAVGERSSALMKLGYYLAEMGLNDGEIFSVLRNADDRWKKFAGRQDRDRRLLDLISKARIKYPAFVEINDDDTIQLFGWKSLLDSTIKIEWLIPDLLQSQGYLLLTGPSGVGKTQFSLQWAIHLALGKRFLDFDISRQYRILIMSLEMGHGDLKYFMSSMSKELTPTELEVLEQNIILAPIGEPMYLDSQTGQDKFEQLLTVIKPDIFMWDSVGSSSTGDISSEQTVKTIMGYNDKLRQKYQVASWYIHHNRKATADNRKPNKLSDVYGNQYLVNRATTVYCLWPNADEIEVIPLKKRLAKLEKPWAVKRNDATLNFEKRSLLSALAADSSTVLDFIPDGPTDNDLEGTVDVPGFEF